MAKISGLIAAALVGWSAPAWAETVTYECVVQPITYAKEVFSPFRNPIQPRMTIVVDHAAGTATVSDALIQGTNGGPVAATVSEDREKKLVVTWEFFANGDGLAQAKMSMRAALLKQPNKLLVSAAPLGYNLRFEGRGGCQWPGMGGS